MLPFLHNEQDRLFRIFYSEYKPCPFKAVPAEMTGSEKRTPKGHNILQTGRYIRTDSDKQCSKEEKSHP